MPLVRPFRAMETRAWEQPISFAIWAWEIRLGLGWLMMRESRGVISFFFIYIRYQECEATKLEAN